MAAVRLKIARQTCVRALVEREAFPKNYSHEQNGADVYLNRIKAFCVKQSPEVP